MREKVEGHAGEEKRKKGSAYKTGRGAAMGRGRGRRKKGGPEGETPEPQLGEFTGWYLEGVSRCDRVVREEDAPVFVGKRSEREKKREEGEERRT